MDGSGNVEGDGAASLRVRAGVGHGEEEGLVVGQLEVLVAELLAVDGLSTSALLAVSSLPSGQGHARHVQLGALCYVRCRG